MKLESAGVQVGAARVSLQFLLAVACIFAFTACASSRKKERDPVPAQLGSGRMKCPGLRRRRRHFERQL